MEQQDMISTTTALAMVAPHPRGFSITTKTMTEWFKAIGTIEIVKPKFFFVPRNDFIEFCKRNNIRLKNETETTNIEPGR